jgi:hypothetical protein
MFVSNQIVFLELQKTGSTTIRRLLREVVRGKLIGKHNRLTPELLDGSRTIFGSVRNPWSWYVSLWAFGCDHRGDLYRTATRERTFRGLGWRYHPRRAFGRVRQELRRHPETWRQCYSDVDDAAAFRRWLDLVLNGGLPWPELEYRVTPLGRVAGLLSVRYLELYCSTTANKPALPRLDSLEAASSFEREHNHVDHFIRNEALEDDLILALQRSGFNLDEDNLQKIRSGRHRMSSRRRETSHYYDAASAALVEERERIIVERFGYVSPLKAASLPHPRD